ncbi:MAG: CopD family protein [Salibacteraceae bacterium]|nr:CopD family protein [Salibacteraceae bacterium]|tara:strand:+ start:37364 stop:37903 length:540 start_codon:yes stop_codon:yes gene_type:complete
MYFLYTKAFHLIFIVTWFAGLFYIVRLFIYHTEAQEKEDLEKTILSSQFDIMEKRLWFGITWPSAVLVLISAAVMLYHSPGYLTQPFMQVKLTFVLGLYLYHLYIHKIYKEIQSGLFKMSSKKLRVFNEIATVFLVAIVFIIILRDQISWIWGLLGIFTFAFLLWGAISLYKKSRNKNL